MRHNRQIWFAFGNQCENIALEHRGDTSNTELGVDECRKLELIQDEVLKFLQCQELVHCEVPFRNLPSTPYENVEFSSRLSWKQVNTASSLNSERSNNAIYDDVEVYNAMKEDRLNADDGDLTGRQCFNAGVKHNLDQ